MDHLPVHVCSAASYLVPIQRSTAMVAHQLLYGICNIPSLVFVIVQVSERTCALETVARQRLKIHMIHSV